MNVRKKSKGPAPDYPSQRQFSKYKRLLGVAAVGLTAMTGWTGPFRTAGVPVRTGGKVAVEPRPPTPSPAATNACASPVEPVSLPGAIAVAPRQPSDAPPVVANQAATNQQTCATYTIKKGDTLSSLAAHFLGSSSRWSDIVAVNPGVTPESLKVGQSLVIPAMAATNKTDAIRLRGEIRAAPSH